MLWYMIKRAICNKWMLLVCMISVAVFYYEMFFGWVPILSIIKEPQYYNGLTEMDLVFALCAYVVFAGMFPGLPYGSSLLEERNSGYLYFVRQRIPIKKYMKYKMIAIGLSGAVSTVIPYLCVALPLKLATIHSTVPAYENDYGVICSRIVLMCGEGTVYVLKGLLMALFGILWAELTLLISLIIRNRYIVYILPFVIHQVLWNVLPNKIGPIFLIRYSADYDASLMFPYVLFGIYIAGVLFAIWLIFRRQVKNEKF